MGIDCRFLVGGLEKWLVEKRPLTGLNARTLSDLRAVPAHRNQSVLLDTEQVRDLLDKEGAVFVDIRYPGRVQERSPAERDQPADPADADRGQDQAVAAAETADRRALLRPPLVLLRRGAGP